MNSELKLIQLLREEMVLALGCTEPIALAYTAALVTKHLGHPPEQLLVECSANMIKNVKSVIVPNSGGMKGIVVACILGSYFGDSDRKLEVLSGISAQQIETCKTLIKQIPCNISLLESDSTLHIMITGKYKNDSVCVEIRDGHTNVVSITKNGEQLNLKPYISASTNSENSKPFSHILMQDIITFARFSDYSPLIQLLDQEIKNNMAIAKEGLNNHYGINVGKTLLLTSENNVRNRAKAFAASGSDARMSGCDLPVMINSGSGNQGLTVSLPIIVYAEELNSTKEQLYRALILSNLIALYEKSYIGKLSAYCGVVCAASGSAAGITFLKNGTDEQIKNAVSNTLGTLSGMICDGAKASCASKIATCVESAIMSHELAMQGNVLSEGDGIIKKDLDNTIKSVGKLANKGMKITDKVILNIMLDK